jgi:hypothetical protein
MAVPVVSKIQNPIVEACDVCLNNLRVRDIGVQDPHLIVYEVRATADLASHGSDIRFVNIECNVPRPPSC